LQPDVVMHIAPVTKRFTSERAWSTPVGRQAHALFSAIFDMSHFCKTICSRSCYCCVIEHNAVRSVRPSANAGRSTKDNGCQVLAAPHGSTLQCIIVPLGLQGTWGAAVCCCPPQHTAWVVLFSGTQTTHSIESWMMPLMGSQLSSCCRRQRRQAIRFFFCEHGSLED
jgi:hypothetical protein